MQDNTAKATGEVDLQNILDALEDPDCRTILQMTAEPMTANELTATSGVPQSTLYRKLDLLNRASLVREIFEIVPEGGRVSHYQRALSDITITITESDQFTINVERPSHSAEERLADMWSKMEDEV